MYPPFYELKISKDITEDANIGRKCLNLEAIEITFVHVFFSNLLPVNKNIQMLYLVYEVCLWKFYKNQTQLPYTI